MKGGQIGIKNVEWWADGSRFERIVDLTSFVKYQYENNIINHENPYSQLTTPFEKLYKLPEGLEIHESILPETSENDFNVEDSILSKYSIKF